MHAEQPCICMQSSQGAAHACQPVCCASMQRGMEGSGCMAVRGTLVFLELHLMTKSPLTKQGGAKSLRLGTFLSSRTFPIQTGFNFSPLTKNFSPFLFGTRD